MKKNLLVLITGLFVVASVLLASCKKEHCYECEKNAGQPDYVHVVAVGEDQKSTYEAQGLTCTDNGQKKRVKKH